MFHETTSGEHTPDAALAEAMTWLGRTPDGMADVVLCTLPGRLRREQERALSLEIVRVLDRDHGSLWVWGTVAGLAGVEYQHLTGDLSHAWRSWDRPALAPDIPMPSWAAMCREFPPSLVDYCLRASAGPDRLCLDLFPRAPHIAQSVGRDIGALVLTVAPVADLYTAPHTAPPPWVHSRAFHDEFFSRLIQRGNCLVYPSKPHASGYARLRVAGREYYAHHVSWMLSHQRAIPLGTPVLHASCPDRRCCTPGHLRLGPVAVNLDERWLGRRAKG